MGGAAPAQTPDASPFLRRGAFPGPVDLDLGNLMAYEPRGPPEEELKKDATAACIAHGRDVLQKLVVRCSALAHLARMGRATAENGALWRRCGEILGSTHQAWLRGS